MGSSKEIVSTLNGFDLFWAIYPRHLAKKDAQKAWEKIAPSPEQVTTILLAVKEQRLERAIKTARREWVPEWPYPASWLRGERWTDEVKFAGPSIDLAKARATMSPEVYRRLLEQVKR